MSNSIFQNVIGQLREATDRVLGVIDTDGNVVSCTDPALLGERWTDAALKVGSADGLVVFDGKIAETGSHDDLMAQNGIYAGMYNAQFI